MMGAVAPPGRDEAACNKTTCHIDIEKVSAKDGNGWSTPSPSCPLPWSHRIHKSSAGITAVYRHFKRYCATVPWGMHPRGYGGTGRSPNPTPGGGSCALPSARRPPPSRPSRAGSPSPATRPVRALRRGVAPGGAGRLGHALVGCSPGWAARGVRADARRGHQREQGGRGWADAVGGKGRLIFPDSIGCSGKIPCC